MDSSELIAQLLDKDVLMPVLIFGSITICVVATIIASTVQSNARERTRREIAAYIAEGSMSPEQGERLLNAGKKSC